MEQPTTDELKQAFKASRLWAIGYSFDKAMSISAIRTSLCGAVKAARKRIPADRRQIQPGLI